MHARSLGTILARKFWLQTGRTNERALSSVAANRQQRPGASVFAILFAVESIARGIVPTVVTVPALDLLDSVRDVSVLFSTVGVVGLLASLSIPALVRLCSRRWIYTLGAVLLIASALALATHTLPGQIVGMFARVYGTACLNIALSLFILQYIRRSELVVSEPRRLQYSALAWTNWAGARSDALPSLPTSLRQCAVKGALT